jgi:hypothetical protein
VPVAAPAPAAAPALAAPAFTISSDSESKPVNSAITGYTIDSTGGAIASYSISPAAPAGLTFDTSDGTLSGTPTSVASATAYTITATNASGSATQTFTLTVTEIIYVVGDPGPGGGKIFYVAPEGTSFACGPTRAATCTYLEAAPSGWNTRNDPTLSWANTTNKSTTVNNTTSPETATATAIGWGYRNTRAIILQGNSDTATSAAALADSYTSTGPGGTYDDWYLPSKEELNQLYLNSAAVGGFANGRYWSSSEGANNYAWDKNFNDGTQYGLNKDQPGYVRPVRAF